MRERIKQARMASGLSQQAVADMCGVSRGAVAQWETGATKSVSYENLRVLAEACGTTVDWLMGQDEPPACDHKLLHAVVTRVEQAMQDAGVELPAEKHADLVVLLFNWHEERGQSEISQVEVDRLLSLVS